MAAGRKEDFQETTVYPSNNGIRHAEVFYPLAV